MLQKKRYTLNPSRELPWNDLPLLPIDESYYRAADVLEQLGESKAALARLHGRSIAIPNPGILVNTISLQEARDSSAIENIFTTDDELYKAYSETGQESHSNEHPASKEILHYREALWSGHTYLRKSKAGFTEAYFIELFREIKQSNESFRKEFNDTRIRQGGTGPNAGKIIYTPPKGERVIRAKIKNLLDFINDDEKYRLDPILKMAIAHYQFEAIHPFRDGNGRVGRVFNIHLLTQKGLLDLPFLFLSRYIMDNKDDYYSGLNGVSGRGDWKTWLLFMLKAVEVTSNLTYRKVNDILMAKENILEYIIEKDPKIQRPEQLVLMLFTQPFTRVKHLQESKLYAENTARDYLNRLAKMGVVEKKSIEGSHYYLNTELYHILSE